MNYSCGVYSYFVASKNTARVAYKWHMHIQCEPSIFPQGAYPSASLARQTLYPTNRSYRAERLGKGFGAPEYPSA